jgi:hypothetical protein
MATTIAQKNMLSEIQTIASELLSIKARMVSIIAMYTNEGLNDLTDADFVALPEFAHITAVEFQAAVAALVAVNTALGDYSASSNVAKLFRIVRGVPR